MRSIKLPSWTKRLLGLDPRPGAAARLLCSMPAALVYGRFVRAESGFEVEDVSRVDLPEGLFAEGPLGGPMHDVGLFKPLLTELRGERRQSGVWRRDAACCPTPG